MPQQSTSLNTDQGNKPTSGYYEDAGAGTSKWLIWIKKANGGDAALGATTDAAATGDGTLIAVVKRLRTLLNGGLPTALSAGGGLKVGVVDALPAGANAIGGVTVSSLPALLTGANAIGSTIGRHGEITVRASAIMNASAQGIDVDFSTYKRGIFIVDVTAVAGAGVMDLYFQAKAVTLVKYGRISDPTTGVGMKINGSTTISAVGTYAYQWDKPLPATGRVDITLVSGTSLTFSMYFIGES